MVKLDFVSFLPNSSTDLLTVSYDKYRQKGYENIDKGNKLIKCKSYLLREICKFSKPNRRAQIQDAIDKLCQQAKGSL